MSVTTCPACGRALQVPEEYLGKKVRCPDCQHEFSAGASADTDETGVQTGPAPAPPPTSIQPPAAWEDERPSRRPADDDDDDYEDRPRSIRSRQRGTSARAVMALTFGITGVVGGLFSLCCCLGFAMGIGLGVTGTLLGHLELQAIREGSASAQGETMARTGYILGIVAIALTLLMLVLYCLINGMSLAMNPNGPFGRNF